MTRTKVNVYCSLISKENYNEEMGYYSFSPTEFHPEPKNVEWVYGGGIQPESLKPLNRLPEEDVEVTIFSDKDLLSPMTDQVNTKYKVALLNECRSIHPFAYEWITMVEDKFDLILTYDKDLLNRGPKYVFYKTVHAGGSIHKEDCKIQKKSKLASIIISKKGKDIEISKLARGHKLRHLIVDNLITKRNLDVDLWGRAYKSFDYKMDPLGQYYFSLSITNAKHENYFNDNLVDCFRLGTIPVFWGCPNIGDFFNTDGILSFDTGPELLDILESISPDLYHQKLEAVKDNLKRAESFFDSDDNLFAVIKKNLNLS